MENYPYSSSPHTETRKREDPNIVQDVAKQGIQYIVSSLPIPIGGYSRVVMIY